ncbi:MAG: type II CRISPR RNA-guided endonuclease Cas9 [Arcobacter sp.]|jgi:CRISPR-associated endonuclease Csn1|uniref:type II CRISPR RNA-guided endonuclease Cas9 n=1 Tax=Arcobacter sp. TaxID=1872629 RepID=UPI002A750650|nr:type II CRISPR RNA-guided endonuclease Cas9 [Arcobacter sp.]MDY3204180.1 type II CRISPR RNA-guided endonuclease Cas9 [Arcobacter sp.]
MENLLSKKVLGLDIGSNSIGYSLLELEEKDNQIIFNELVSNSIIFSEPFLASERREARSSRRRNERKSNRNKNARNIYVSFSIANEEFISSPTDYLNNFRLKDNDVYNIREKTVEGEFLTKEEFILSTYSILTDRGYSNMFSISSNEDGIINDAVSKNAKEYQSKNFKLPSMVLTQKRKDLEKTYQNIPIRNKKDDYQNSLDRNMHIEEFKKVVLSQSNNKEIFSSEEKCHSFIEEIIDKKYGSFYQRPLKSFESMVEYCSYYDEFNPKGSYKRIPLSNYKNIELTLRQKIDNYSAINTKTGEIKIFTKEELNEIIKFWINTPSSKEINASNIFKSVGFKDIKLNIPEQSSQIVLNIQAHKNILEILNKYNIDFQDTQNDFYNKVLLELYYFKNNSSRIENISKLVKQFNLIIDNSFIEELALLENMDGFGSFSLEFITEVLDLINNKNKTFHEALENLEYFSKYLDMPTYDYLPPLEPTKADIKWLQENISYFDTKHLFYQPMMSPKVKRVISVLRKLINDIIKRYGKIDEIRIETAKMPNSKKEQERIDKNQSKDRAKNNDAIKLLKSYDLKESSKNIEIAKLWKEQGGECLYSGEEITQEEAFDENETEVEHFIPRSVIWINSYKNKILVKKKYNQNKASQHPISYLQSIGQWENFKGRVSKKYMAFEKKDWLIKEEIINSVMQKEHWQDSFLNDTRSATKTIQKYLNHYLYPKETLYGKGEKRSIFSISGKAISELKYIWGVNDVMPKNESDKKDRNTNYHHTLDAFTIALCSNSAINTLHNHFIKNENKFKTKAQKEQLALNVPISKNGVNLTEYLKNIVEKYENNKLYVCPYNKRKTNMKGFKDGNLKLYITKDKNDNEILAELEKISIDTSILIKTVGGFPKPRTDKEVLEYIESLQERLDPIKQKNIIKAIETYAKELLELRTKINETIKPFAEENKLLSNQLQKLKCTFTIKNGKKQIVKALKLQKIKIEETKADAILFKNKIERLSISNFKEALENKKPFVIKMNESTLNVQLFNTKDRGQAVGLNYFSSIANDVKTKINDKFADELKGKVADLTLYKNDIIKVENIKDLKTEYYIFNGGGLIAGSNNKISIKNINLNSFIKTDKKGEIKECKEDNVTPNKNTIISKVNIDFFGNIVEV